MNRYLFILLALLSCTGCGLIIGKLPEPDKFWSVATQGPQSEACKNAEQVDGGCEDDYQKSAAVNVNAFLKSKLPISTANLTRYLKTQSFQCQPSDDYKRLECTYNRSFAWQPCISKIMVVIVITYPNSSERDVSYSDLRTAAMAVDTKEQEDLGCFPI